jgi:hypothetical protein
MTAEQLGPERMGTERMGTERMGTERMGTGRMGTGQKDAGPAKPWPEDDEVLDAAIEELLGRIDRVDLEWALEKFDSRSALVARMAEQARDVLAARSKAGRPIPRERYPYLAAAMLTWGREHAGVHLSLANALDRYDVVSKDPDLPVEVAVLARRDIDPQTLALMGATFRVTGGLVALRPGVPPQFLRMIVATVLDRFPTASRPAALSCSVLDRGAELAARYRASGRPLPGSEPMPVRGNADFLLAVAGYRAALGELCTAEVAEDPLAEIESGLSELEASLRHGMHAPASWTDRGGVDEPDIVGFYGGVAAFLGGDRVRVVIAHLDRGLRRARLRHDPKSVPVDPEFVAQRDRQAPVPDGPDPVHIAGWLVAAFVTGTDRDRATAVSWLAGDRRADLQDGLPELVERMWLARRDLAELPEPAAPRPAGLDRADHQRLLDGLATRIADALALGMGPGSVRLMSVVLPALWSRRPAAIRWLRAGLRVDGQTPADATVVAAVAACSPAQAAVAGAVAQHADPGACVRSDELTDRCTARGTGPSPAAIEVCPGRPWAEAGIVESYRTLADLAQKKPEAIRKLLKRYGGPWAEAIRLMPRELVPGTRAER